MDGAWRHRGGVLEEFGGESEREIAFAFGEARRRLWF